MGEWASLDRAADLWRAWLFGEGVGLWTPRAGICGTPRSSDRGRQSTYQTVFITLANTWLSTQVEDFEVWHERWPLLEKWSPEEDGRDPGYISYNSQPFKKKQKRRFWKSVYLFLGMWMRTWTGLLSHQKLVIVVKYIKIYCMRSEYIMWTCCLLSCVSIWYIRFPQCICGYIKNLKIRESNTFTHEMRTAKTDKHFSKQLSTMLRTLLFIFFKQIWCTISVHNV